LHCGVNKTSDYTLFTLFRFYFKDINANIELQVYSATCCWRYNNCIVSNSIDKLEQRTNIDLHVMDVYVYTFIYEYIINIIMYIFRQWHQSRKDWKRTVWAVLHVMRRERGRPKIRWIDCVWDGIWEIDVSDEITRRHFIEEYWNLKRAAPIPNKCNKSKRMMVIVLLLWLYLLSRIHNFTSE
jgi:hypothetical protein